MAGRKKRVTLRDVALAARVSAATVSYSLNESTSRSARIPDATRDRVIAAARELGYVPHGPARSLKRDRSGLVCLSIPKLGVPYYDALADVLQQEAQARGHHLIIAVHRRGDEAEELLRRLRGGFADALVMVVEQESSAALAPRLAELGRAGVACVAFSNEMSPEGFDVVRDTDREACVEAVGYLIDQGHERIGCLALDLGDGTRHARYDMYVRALAAAGIEPDPALVRDSTRNWDDAYAAARSLLSSPGRPTAVFACTDVAGLSTIRAARHARLRVPDDVSVIGVGDILEGEFTDPPLTTVGPERRDFRDVAELVFSRLRSQEPLAGRHIVKRWNLKIRGSASPPAALKEGG